MARFRDLGEFGPTLDAAAERLGISPTAVEKDYWVSEVLRVLGETLAGTSYSKAEPAFQRAFGWWNASQRTLMSWFCPGSEDAERPTSS